MPFSRGIPYDRMMIVAAILALQIQAVPRIHLSLSAFAAQYGALRAMLESKEMPASQGMKAGVEDLARIEQSFPHVIRTRTGEMIEGPPAKVTELYWRTLDALTFSAGSADRLGDVAEIMPKIGGELDTGAAMRGIQHAVDESKQDFDSQVWPREARVAQECVDSFEKISVEKQDEALRFIMRAAGIAKAPKQIEILVLPRMAGKEGMTVRTPGGTLIVIGAGKYRGADFAEVVLHEATHVLDTAAGQDSFFGKLRVALKAAGHSAFELEQGPHVAMFLLAAEATRRNFDSKHKDVGETFGAYSRGLEPLRKVVEPVLRKLIAHEIDADAAVQAIVGRLAFHNANLVFLPCTS